MARPLKFQSVEDLQSKINAYFQSFDEGGENRDRPMTITGLAIWLGTTRELLCDYQERDEFSDTVKAAKLRIEQFAEERLYIGKNAAGPIFALKNFGWKDNHEFSGPGGGPIKTENTSLVAVAELKGKTPQELARLYADIVRSGK